ncbi:MAG: NADPH-dependent assimilatory sulfite reductase hemoprotein subunit [Planctomycetota bacterium]|nr:NADPH-dependent assimilatory sulfite reductase hemoprotein subunit [Planctomycetota bacterium]
MLAFVRMPARGGSARGAKPRDFNMSAEEIKKNSRGLRGTVAETLAGGAASFSKPDQNVIKFHGIYQEEDRDQRIARIKAKQDRAWILMVRTKLPGGQLTAKQYLALDKLCDELGNGTLRITTRQDFQFHGVVQQDLKPLIRKLNEVEVTTFGGCGDVERNVVASPAPFADEVHREVQRLAQEISAATLPATRAYFEIWLDGAKLPREAPAEPDPLYKDVYLPRKFKTAIVAPPRNDVDIYAHDLGFIPHVEGGRIAGYTVVAGGSFGMDHGKQTTYPFLAVPLLYVGKAHALDVAKAVIAAFRDYGDRTNRKHARLKYQIAERGIAWLRKEVESRMPGVKTADPRPVELGSVEDWLGWHEQGDGKLFHGVKIECGRLMDYENGPRARTGCRAVVERFGCDVRLTANQNILFINLKPGDRAAVDALLAEHGLKAAESYTAAHRMGIACTALPTCNLALSESERVFPGLMDKLDGVLRELGLEREPILFRMTGCPNGCARPYNADFAFVGRGIGKYAVYVGGSYRGDRMAGLARTTENLDDLPGFVRGVLGNFKQGRKQGESFTDWWGRTQPAGPAPHPEQFHVELEARRARLAAAKSGGGAAN